MTPRYWLYLSLASSLMSSYNSLPNWNCASTTLSLHEKRHNTTSIIAKKKKKNGCNIYTIASLGCFLL